MRGKRIRIPAQYEICLEDFGIDERVLRGSEILMKTHYTLISPGTELAIYTALDKDVHESGSWCHYPFNPGYISVGEVVKIGQDVSEVSESDVVFTYSNHASIASVDPTRTICLKLPAEIDEKDSLFAMAATIAMTALRVSSGELCDNVAVVDRSIDEVSLDSWLLRLLFLVGDWFEYCLEVMVLYTELLRHISQEAD